MNSDINDGVDAGFQMFPTPDLELLNTDYVFVKCRVHLPKF